MRPSLVISGVAIAVLTLAGCSSRSNLQVTPQSQVSTSQSRTPASVAAYPISLSAYPSSLGAYPVSAEAFPICSLSLGTVTNLLSGLSLAKSSTNERHGDCGGKRRLASLGAGTPASALPGYQPLHLQGAYGVDKDADLVGDGETVAIVTAYVDSAIEADLGVYRDTFGLRPCTAKNGCLRVVAPHSNPGLLGGLLGGVTTILNPSPAKKAWAEETAIDTEMVSAICPRCNILVVEADSDAIKDLGSAVDIAAAFNPVAISNSYATTEDDQSIPYAGKWRRGGTAVVAGAGDAGYGVSFPASVENVIAVGGTTLPQNPDGTFGRQTIWAGTGSGCSAYIRKPAWQTDSGCRNRTVNDIAAVADPRTGVAAFSSYGGGWNVYGGTSVATPIIAGMFALTGSTRNVHDASHIYAAPDRSLAWIFGSNGTCSPSYLCTADGDAYNGPAGNGVPYGLAAFR